jgi:hypothetical protein
MSATLPLRVTEGLARHTAKDLRPLPCARQWEVRSGTEYPRELFADWNCRVLRQLLNGLDITSYLIQV